MIGGFLPKPLFSTTSWNGTRPHREHYRAARDGTNTRSGMGVKRFLFLGTERVSLIVYILPKQFEMERWGMSGRVWGSSGTVTDSVRWMRGGMNPGILKRRRIQFWIISGNFEDKSRVFSRWQLQKWDIETLIQCGRAHVWRERRISIDWHDFFIDKTGCIIKTFRTWAIWCTHLTNIICT